MRSNFKSQKYGYESKNQHIKINSKNESTPRAA
jgi:hypothetical protein